VPLACAKRLTAIAEQDLLACRDGYRPGRGALDAVRALTFDLPYGRYGYRVAADIPGCFDHRDHAWRVDMLRGRIEARAWLKLIRTWLKAGGLETDGQVIHPETGPPQGGTVSPVLAHGSLHDALDLWLDTVVKAPGRGAALWCCSADDGVCACRSQDDAERFYRVLPQRRKQCNLQVAPEPTHRRRLSRLHPRMKQRVTCLGCAFAWMPDRPGVPRVRRRTARKKLQAACQRLTGWIKPHRHLLERACFQRLHARLRGPYH
jgi:RNA-directed DNA polymerase